MTTEIPSLVTTLKTVSEAIVTRVAVIMSTKAVAMTTETLPTDERAAESGPTGAYYVAGCAFGGVSTACVITLLLYMLIKFLRKTGSSGSSGNIYNVCSCRCCPVYNNGTTRFDREQSDMPPAYSKQCDMPNPYIANVSSTQFWYEDSD